MRAFCFVISLLVFCSNCCAMAEIGKFNHAAYQLKSAANNAKGILNLTDTETNRHHKKNKKRNKKNSKKNKQFVNYNNSSKFSSYTNLQDEDETEENLNDFSSIDDFYNDQGIMKVAISEKGTSVAVFRHNEMVEIKERNSNRKKRPSYIIQASNFGGVKSLLVGDNCILYTYRDKKKKRHLMLYKRGGEQSFVEITPVQDSERIRLFGRENFIIIVSQATKKSFIHKLDVSELDDDLSKESLKKALTQVVTSEYPITDVVVNSNNNTFIYVTGPEDEKSLTLYEDGNIRMMGPSGNNDHYIALDNRDVIYKLNNGKIWTVMKSGMSVNMGDAKIDDNCKVHTDSNGVPCFVTWCDVFFQHVVLQRSLSIGNKKYDTSTIIKKLDKHFAGQNWLRVDSTKDNRQWLIKATHAGRPTEYYVVDVINMSFELVAKDKYSITHSTRHVRISVQNNNKSRGKKIGRREISAICTFPKKYNSESPVVIFLRRAENRYFSWEYDPLAQFLADIGLFVIGVNQMCDDDEETERSVVIDEIYHIMNWLSIKRNFSDGFKKSRTIWPIACDKTVIVANCKNVEPMLRYFVKKGIEDGDGNKLGGLCLIDPRRTDLLKNAKLSTPTLALFPIEPSDKMSGKNLSALVAPANEDAARALAISRFALWSVSSAESRKQIENGNGEMNKMKKNMKIINDPSKIFSLKRN